MKEQLRQSLQKLQFNVPSDHYSPQAALVEMGRRPRIETFIEDESSSRTVESAQKEERGKALAAVSFTDYDCYDIDVHDDYDEDGFHSCGEDDRDYQSVHQFAGAKDPKVANVDNANCRRRSLPITAKMTAMKS